MLRLLLLSVLAFSLLVPPVSAQTPEAAKRFTYVTGTALDLVPDGKPGIIDIIPVGPYGPRGIPVVVWNHTARTVTDLHVFGMIRTAEGQLLAAGRSRSSRMSSRSGPLLSPWSRLPGRCRTNRPPTT